MYHAIVRMRIRSLFDAINRGDAEPVLGTFAKNFEHTFLGDSALGGTRRTLSATKAWYQRLYRLLPDIRFELETTVVAGTPWNTIAFVRWRETNSGTDGVQTENRGVHVVRLRFGRATHLLICPDTDGLVMTLERLAKSGNAEAAMPPIVDR